MCCSQCQTIYCHTAYQQQPEIMGLASRAEDCTRYSHSNQSINHNLLKELKQRVKFQIKKKIGHRKIFLLWRQKYIICVSLHFYLYTHVGINLHYSPCKWIQQSFSYSGIISYFNKTNKQGLILATESFHPIKIWQVGVKHFLKLLTGLLGGYTGTSGKNIKKWQSNQENIIWILMFY